MTITSYYKVLLTFVFSIYSLCVFSQIKTSAVPNWVVEQTYETNPDINLEDISFGLLTLLSDEQVHIPKQERYIRYARKITNSVGVQDGSAISINYDPSYQQLFLHDITVFRDGKRINKLNVNDFQTIRQESNAESYIYDGSLNAVANLADIRSGDILDFSYTIRGFNPIHGSHFSGATALNDFQTVGKINYYLISNKPLQYKVLNTDNKPTIGSYQGYTTYNWQSELEDAPNFEENTPTWYLQYQNLFVSDFESWEEVVDWALSIYKENAVFSEELKAKIDQIKSSHDSEPERIRATLKFVQEEIRYLGLESGIGAYKPFSPSKVLDQRFGDCKDKTWLMVSMLRSMDIEAYPALISSLYGQSLDAFLPSPKVFDHVVVKVIDSTANQYWYDPTITNQFGSYKSISFPDYGKALVINKGVDDLETIEIKQENLVEVFDTFDLDTVGGSATLYVMTAYNDSEADAMRARYKSSSIATLKSDFKSYYDNLYDGVKVTKDPIFDDDSLSNRIVVEEFYKINEFWSPMVGDGSQISAEFYPYSILDILLSPNESTRKTPYALYHPTHKKHNITVKLPRRWGIAKDNFTIESKHFDFSLKTKMNRSQDILYLNYNYENKDSYVPTENFDEYYNDIKRVEQNIAYYIYIPKTEINTSARPSKPFITENFKSTLTTIFYWVFGICVLIILRLILYIVNNNKKDR